MESVTEYRSKVISVSGLFKDTHGALCKTRLIRQQSLMTGQFFIITYITLCIVILLFASIHKSCCELESCEILGQNPHVALCLSVYPDPLSHCIQPLYLSLLLFSLSPLLWNVKWKFSFSLYYPIDGGNIRITWYIKSVLHRERLCVRVCLCACECLRAYLYIYIYIYWREMRMKTCKRSVVHRK